MSSRASSLDPALLRLLVCPVSKGELLFDEEAQELICERSRLAYPVRDGVPVMLPEEARRLPSPEHSTPGEKA